MFNLKKNLFPIFSKNTLITGFFVCGGLAKFSKIKIHFIST
jgi:hypothetical protein